MMITAHSVLRDRYNRLSSLFEILLLILSIILNSLIFVDAKFLEKFTGVNEDHQKLFTGLAGLSVFIISMVMFQVSWREVATRHGIAVDRLFILKQKCKLIILTPNSSNKTLAIAEFDKNYTDVFSDLIKIPEKKFNSLKLIHYRKVELSKLIEQRPNSRMWFLKIKLFCSSFKK